MTVEVRGCGETLGTGGVEGGDKQAEPRDRNREGIDIDTVNGVERALRVDAAAVARRPLQPPIEEPLESAEEEVPGPARRVDHRRVVETERVDRGIERAIEDELLDEVW